MRSGIAILVKRDLDAGHTGHRKDFLDPYRGRMSPSPTHRTEQHDAEPVSAPAVGKSPIVARVEVDQRVDPSVTVQIRPLIAHPQMYFDRRAADRLEIDHASVVVKMGGDPSAERRFQRGLRIRMDGPVVECATSRRTAGSVTPPARIAAHDCGIRTDVPAVEQGHPHVARRPVAFVVNTRSEDAGSQPHPLQVDDRFREHGKARRERTVCPCCQSLAACNGDAVIHPPMPGIPGPCVAVFSGNSDRCRAAGVREVLEAPRIDFADWHVPTYYDHDFPCAGD